MNYKYALSHQWLKFKAQLDEAPPRFWILSGEAKSKCEHIASVPLKPAVSLKLQAVYLVRGIRATVAIEGNTLSEEQVKQRLEGTLSLPESQEYLGTEVDNIIAAVNQIGGEIAEHQIPKLSVKLIKEYNRLILKGLKLDAGVIPGEIRVGSFGVAHYRGAPADECEYLLERLCEWLNGPEFDIPNDKNRTITAILKAIIAHIYIEWIHPFGDGNGRVGRLTEFFILLSSGIPSPAAHLLSNHYNLTRSEYYRHLDESSRSGGNLLPFMEYALQGFVDGLRLQLKDIRNQQWNLAWESFVYEHFGNKTSPSDQRRCHLVLDLSSSRKPVTLEKVALLTPRLAAAYATKRPRTVIRDLNRLIEMGLVQLTKAGYRARKRSILAFLPLTHEPISESKDTGAATRRRVAPA